MWIPAARQSVDWSKLSVWTWLREHNNDERTSFQTLKRWGSAAPLTLQHNYCQCIALIKPFVYSTARKYLFIFCSLARQWSFFFLFFLLCVCVRWLCHKSFVLSMLEVQRESIHRRARGRVILDDKIPTTCWNSTFLPAGWPLAFLNVSAGWRRRPVGARRGVARSVVVLNYGTRWLRRCSVIVSFLCKWHSLPP